MTRSRTLTDIAAELGTSKSNITHRIKALSIPCRGHAGRRHAGSPPARHHPPNWTSLAGSPAANSGKLAGKPQVSQDRLEKSSGNLQAELRPIAS